MIRIGKYLLAVASAFALIACGGTAVDNKPSNTNATNANTNAGKPTAAAPNKDALFAMDKQANEAWIKGDSSFFNGFLSDKFVSYDQGQRRSKADLVKMMADFKCDVKTWSVDDPQMVTIDADTVVLTYKGMFDGSCSGPDGSMKLPSPIQAASIFVRSGDKWQGVFHAENLVVDPKAPPPPPADGKKDPAKKEESKPADKLAGDANTEALAKVHQSGWEAWKAKDAKRFEEMATASLSIVDPMGRWIGTKAETIKHWTEMKCEGVTKVNVSDAVATALSPTVELLTLKGAADGTCEGRKNGDIYQSALYIKEGDAWKLAFMFEAPAM